MDAVSYSHADKQKQRIEKFIEQPDSTSGVVTVPDTIASGENIEIPTGRQIVVDHLDVQGTLDMQGTLATVSGGYLSQTTIKTQAIANTDCTVAMNIDTSGNVGISVTPSAWNSNHKNISIGYGATLTGYSSSGWCSLGSNGYSDGTWKYINSTYATKYDQLNGNHTWYTAPSGTAGNAITWTTAMTLDANGNLQFNSGYGSVATAYGCRAWANFNGTGTVAIRASGNVSSITDNGTGDYTVNFTSAMSDTNYCSIVSQSFSYGVSAIMGGTNTSTSLTESAPLTTSFRFSFAGWNGTYYDAKYASVSIFR